MSFTLSDGTSTLALDPDLIWTDEHAWQAPEQTAVRTLTGALIVQSAAKVKGRPITLEAGEGHAWMPYTDFAQLAAWAAVPGQVLTLTLRGQTMSVGFRHHDAPAIEARPLIDTAASETLPSDAWMVASLKLYTV